MYLYKSYTFAIYWRALIQTYPWFVVAFAGLHTLEEMRRDYFQPLFGSVTAIPVSFLEPGAARELITNPAPDFPLDYDDAAVTEIIRLTSGQPYLLQLLCHNLVSRFNRRTLEEGREGERRFFAQDVVAVVESKEFFRDGNAYFTGVWSQADAQQPVLRALADAPAGLATDTLQVKTGLATEALEDALKILARHDVVTAESGVYRYTPWN